MQNPHIYNQIYIYIIKYIYIYNYIYIYIIIYIYYIHIHIHGPAFGGPLPPRWWWCLYVYVYKIYIYIYITYIYMQEVYIYIYTHVGVYVCSMCMCKHIQYVNVCVYAYLYVSLPRCWEWGGGRRSFESSCGKSWDRRRPNCRRSAARAPKVGSPCHGMMGFSWDWDDLWWSIRWIIPSTIHTRHPEKKWNGPKFMCKSPTKPWFMGRCLGLGGTDHEWLYNWYNWHNCYIWGIG